MNISSKTALVILSIILGFFVTLNCFWIYFNNVPLFDDTAGHTVLTFIYSNIWSGRFDFPPLKELLTLSPYYPPVVFIISSIFPLVFGYGFKVLQYWSQCFLILTTLFLFLYAQKITKNTLLALFAAIWFISFPNVWEGSRYFMLDIPFTAFLLISLYSLERSLHFRRGRWTILFFLFAAFTQLTKWYAVVYLFVPTLFHFVQAIKQIDKNRIRYMVIGLAMALTLVLPWYLVNLHILVPNLTEAAGPEMGSPNQLLSLVNIIFYPVLMLNYQIVSIQFLFLVVSIGVYLFLPSEPKRFILAQIAFVSLIFMFVGNKNIRYVLPLLPFIAMVMAFTSYTLFKKKSILSYVINGGLFVFSLLLFTITSFGFPPVAQKLFAIRPTEALPHLFLLDLSSQYVPYQFKNIRWTSEEIVRDMGKGDLKEPSILVISNTPLVSAASMGIYTMSLYPLLHLHEVPINLERFASPELIDSYLHEFDYLIVPDQNVAPDTKYNKYNLDELRKYILGGKTRDFSLWKTYTLPNGEFLYLLEKNPTKNHLSITVKNNSIAFSRNPSVANVYFQFKSGNGTWTQNNLNQHETYFYKNLSEIDIIRFDYPVRLTDVVTDSEWTYDGDQQITRVK